jgi:hypothetical protein
MPDDSRFDTAAARIRSPHGRPQVIRPEDLVWPPPQEDLQAFSVIKVGEDDERAESLLIVAGVAASEHPQPKVAAPASARTAPPAIPPAAKPVPQRVVPWPREAVRPRDAAPHHVGLWSRLALRRWAWLARLVAALLAVGF